MEERLVDKGWGMNVLGGGRAKTAILGREVLREGKVTRGQP
jgi:hypothetical protein